MTEKRLRLTDQDREFLHQLRADGVLKDMEGHRIDLRSGIVGIPCSDGDQMYDVFIYHAEICRAQRQGPPRLHWPSLNGGILLLAPESPLSAHLPDGDVLLRHVLAGSSMKQIRTILAPVHFPCTAAYAHKLPARQSMRLAFAAKTRLREAALQHQRDEGVEKPAVQVRVDPHVDWGNRTRSYFVERAAWEAWDKSH